MERQTDGDKKDVMLGEDEHAKDGSSTILSPMVGTFYRAHPLIPSLLSPLETKSRRSNSLCRGGYEIDERNSSDKTGVIREVLVENGQPVEYGQILFRIG